MNSAKQKQTSFIVKIAPKFAFYTFLILGSVIMLMPLVWMISTASKSLEETLSPRFYLIPQHFQLFENIADAFQEANLLTFFKNSFIVAIIVTVGRIFFSAMAGYSFAKFTYPGRDILFRIVLSTMLIPFYVVTVPLYIVVFQLGLLDTLTALILPFMVTAFGVFLMRQFALGIPDELLDAARIDGASEWRIFLVIVLPLMKPAIAALAIFTFMSSWNDYVWPLFVVLSEAKQTLPLGLATTFKDQYQTVYNQLMAISLIALAPTYILFLFFQRQFIEGITMTGIKG